MKTGQATFTELMQELNERANLRIDSVADARTMRAEPIDGNLALFAAGNRFDMLPNAHEQLGSYLKIPKQYYDRMKAEKPELLARNVNTWLSEKEENRLVRGMRDGNTIDGRAFLSDRYRPIDNFDVGMRVLEAFNNIPNADSTWFQSLQVTENRLYIKVVFPHLEREVKVNDVVKSGICISNSEIGRGGFNVQPLIYRLVCKNGLIVPDAGTKRRHIGSRLTQGITYERDTVIADNTAIMLEFRDTLNAAVNGSMFDEYTYRISQTIEGATITKPIETSETLAKEYGLSQSERESFMANLMTDGDLSRWGALNAVTKIANTTEDYDRATELESIGGRILSLDQSQWSRLVA